MMATNPHEFRNRTKKVDAMVAAVDRLARAADVNPHSALGVSVILDMLGKWTPKHWLELAVQVGSREPSEQTKRLVVGVFTRRSLEIA